MNFFSTAFSEVFGEPPPPGGEEGRGLGVRNVGPDPTQPLGAISRAPKALNGLFFLSFFLNQGESDHDGINLLADMHAIAMGIGIGTGTASASAITDYNDNDNDHHGIECT
jgi:hypothetical protein